MTQVPKNGGDAARMGMSAARNPCGYDGPDYFRWHAEWHEAMRDQARESRNHPVAEQYAKLAGQYRHRAKGEAL